MTPERNPFAPGAGTQPPELSGRESILDGARLALARTRLGRPARGQILLGLRGVGKTVLLNKIAEIAESDGYLTIVLEAPEGRRLADMLVPQLRSTLLKLSKVERARQVARRGMGILRSFAATFKVSVGDVSFGVEAEEGTADSGDLEVDLTEVLVAVGVAAREAVVPVTLLIDEVQYLTTQDLAALIVAVHRIGQKGLPFIVFGAGLPQLAGLAGEAKSYAERLFDYPGVGALDDDAARRAIQTPVTREGVSISTEALDVIVQRARGYPYFLQEWGAQTWDEAPESPITAEDAVRATIAVLTRLDQSFFRVRFDRLTPREKDYVRAMAEIGPGPHRSGDVAQVLGMLVTAAAPLRSGLIKKGMIYSPQHGDTAFTVPMFDEFLKRMIPEPPGKTGKKLKRGARR